MATSEEINEAFGANGPIPYQERPGMGSRGITFFYVSGKRFVTDRIRYRPDGKAVIILRCSMRGCHGRARILPDGPRVAYFDERTRRHQCVVTMNAPTVQN